MDFSLSPSYSTVTLFFAGSASILVLLFLLRKYWTSPSTQLQVLLDQGRTKEQGLHTNYVIPLLAYEERYPSFASILGLVLTQFPLTRFLDKEELRSDFYFLRHAAFQPTDPWPVVTAMCRVVEAFLEDPAVETQFRAQLSVLLDRFLKEIGY